MLDVTGVSLAFGGVAALEDVDVQVRDGEILGVIGPNGAGKSTLMNLVTGVYRPTAGRISFRGKDITGIPDHAIAALGIARTFQSATLFTELDARENVLLGYHLAHHVAGWRRFLRLPDARREEAGLCDRADALLREVGLGEQIEQLAGSLSLGHQRALGIAMALATEPTLLLLDEPVAGLNPTDSAAVATLLRQVRDRGTAVVLVEHDMRTVLSVCDRLVVLDRGRLLLEGPPAEVVADPRVVEAYLGRPTRG